MRRGLYPACAAWHRPNRPLRCVAMRCLVPDPRRAGAGAPHRRDVRRAACRRSSFRSSAPSTFTDDFGEPARRAAASGQRPRRHKRAPVVAVEPGTIEYWTTSASAGCMLYLYGASGTMYEYIHLNNDLTAANDNKGKCVQGVAYAVPDGTHVEAGQTIAYLGDSGDANGIHPHLHFEVHPNGGKAVDPFPFLKKAPHLLLAAPAGGRRLHAPADRHGRRRDGADALTLDRRHAHGVAVAPEADEVEPAPLTLAVQDPAAVDASPATNRSPGRCRRRARCTRSRARRARSRSTGCSRLGGDARLQEVDDLARRRTGREDLGDALLLQLGHVVVRESCRRRRRGGPRLPARAAARGCAARASCARRRGSRSRPRRRPPGSRSRRSAPVSGATRCRSPPCRRRASARAMIFAPRS